MRDAFSIQLPAEQVRFLDKLAKDTAKSRNQIISNAVALMMKNYEYVARLVEEADADFAAGRVISHEEVMKHSQAIVDRTVGRRSDRASFPKRVGRENQLEY